MIELRLLEHALAVEEHRSFARAAKAVHISQPALSRSIQTLESRLGLRLFDRNRKGIVPTDAARVILARARSLTAQGRDLEREAGLLRGLDAGELVIAAGPYPAEMVVGPAVGALLGKHPHLALRIVVDHWVSILERIRSREVEVGICEIGEAVDADLEITPLPPHQGYLVVRARHPLAGRRTVTMEEALEWPFAMSTRVPPRILGRMADPARRARTPRGGFPAVQCDNLEVIRRLVATSDTVGAFTLPLVAPLLQSRAVRLLPLRPPWLRSNYGLIRVRGRIPSPAMEAFVAEVHAAEALLRTREDELARRHLPAAGTGGA